MLRETLVRSQLGALDGLIFRDKATARSKLVSRSAWLDGSGLPSGIQY